MVVFSVCGRGWVFSREGIVWGGYYVGRVLCEVGIVWGG